VADEPDGLIVFDGECRFCSASVDLALSLDPGGATRFTPIQSPYGLLLAAEHGLDPTDPTTFVFFDHGRPLQRSDGALAFAARLHRPWRWAAAVRVVPRPLRDGLYDLIARNRYRWFGRRDRCRMPRPGEAARFALAPPATPAAGAGGA
jgi:predicted DCC family thiol-disulfide oxidoreductase YuxK